VSKYAVTPEGGILREDEEIGRYDPRTGEIQSGDVPQQALAVVKSLILDEIIKQRVAEQPPAPPEAGEPLIFKSEAPLRAAVLSDIPPAPEMNPMMGDKTPAYMEWLAKYHPEDYAVRYKGRKTSVSTGINPFFGGADLPATHMRPEAKEERL
jgi:hypothetical protein